MADYLNELQRVTPESVGVSSGQVEKLVNALQHEFTSMNGFMAARHGKVFAEGWWTPYDSTLVHTNHSVGKSFTCTALAVAESEGFLSFDEKMVDIFADEIREAGIEPEPLLKEITLRDAITMTNGMAHHPAVTDDWICDYFRTPMKYQPGTRFMYNSSGSFLLGAVVTKKTGRDLKDYTTEKIFNKIGIDAERFTWLKFPNGIYAEPGTLAVTEDLLRLSMLYCQGGMWNGERVLPEKFVKEALSVHVDTSYAPEELDGRCGYGYQLWACSRPGVYRFDGGQGQFGIICPEKDLVVAIHEGAMMPYGPQATLDAIYENLIDVITDDEPLPENAEAQKKLVRVLNDLRMPQDPANTFDIHEDMNGTYKITKGSFDPWMSVAPPRANDFFCLFRNREKDIPLTGFELKEEGNGIRVKFGQAEFLAYYDGEQRLQKFENVFDGLDALSATARYINRYTLEVTIHWMNSWTVTKLQFEQRNGGLHMVILKLRLNEEDNWLVSHCRAEKQ